MISAIIHDQGEYTQWPGIILAILCLASRIYSKPWSTVGSLWSPGVTLVNYKGDNISKYFCPTVIIYIARKITKFINFENFEK